MNTGGKKKMTDEQLVVRLCNLISDHVNSSISTPYVTGWYVSSQNVNFQSASHDNWCTVGGDGGCWVSKVWAGTTSPMPDHKDFKLQ